MVDCCLSNETQAYFRWGDEPTSSLAAAEIRLLIRLPDVAAYMVAYGQPDSAWQELARPYDVGMLQVDRELELAPD